MTGRETVCVATLATLANVSSPLDLAVDLSQLPASPGTPSPHHPSVPTAPPPHCRAQASTLTLAISLVLSLVF